MAEERILIDFWDVGQGDGTVIRLPDGKLLVIDIGPKGSPIIDWLAERLFKIHAVVLTHNDDDHAGSLPSLVNLPTVAIEKIYMLLDRDKRSPKFQNIWRPVRNQEQKGRFVVMGLSADSVIWQNGDASFKVLYPTFGENVDASRPNETSAVVCLLHKGAIKIIWPGDAPMQVVAEKCPGTQPHLLHGPHHGGPIDRKKTQFKQFVNGLLPERVFISVGSSNSYNLPSGDYLKLQTSRGCQVTCTQLTRLCDPAQQKPVLQTALLLGLRASRAGIPCRGCFRLTFSDGDVQSDAWDGEHLERVRKLRRAKCLATQTNAA